MTQLVPEVRHEAAPERVATDELELAVGLRGTAVAGRSRPLGFSGLRLHPVALSGQAFGQCVDMLAAERILDAFVDAGGNAIDTADSYAGGASELMIGSWIRSRNARSRVVLATKVGRHPDNPGVSAKAITRAVDASLERLQTDEIDLLFLDLDDPDVPFEETLLAVDELIRVGKVRHFGASDHPGDRYIEARVMAAQAGVARMVAMQSRYSLIEREAYEEGLAPLAAQQELSVMPRSPLADGLLAGAGQERGRGELAAALARMTGAASGHAVRRAARVLAAVGEVAEEHGAPPATVAVAWLLTRPDVVAPVVGVTSPERLEELMAAAELPLTRRQVADLDDASR